MSEVHRNASEESEDSEDIFRSTFSSTGGVGGGGKVKIGGGGGQVGLASAKLKGDLR